MLIVGLTGGISSGKTTVCELFAELGTPIIDADVIAREVVAPGTPALESIAKRFGPEILTAEGELNRLALKAIVFADDSKRLWLENLLHPCIREEMFRQANSYDAPYVILAIPLLVETLPNPQLDKILVIDTDTESQIQRTMARDSLSREQVENILKAQVSREKRLLYADDVIKNTGNLADLRQQVKCLHEKYSKAA